MHWCICSLHLLPINVRKSMSPRIKRPRKILNPPVIKGFKPYGPVVDNENTTAVYLLIEEYESLRLCDYDQVSHLEASAIMGISRPTFTRIYSSARQKIAKAFVEGSQIIIEGGKVYFDSDWYHCNHCGCDFNNLENEIEKINCPLCGSQKVTPLKIDDTIDMSTQKEI